MNIKRQMKEFYAREMRAHGVPGEMPGALANVVPVRNPRTVSSFGLSVAFNAFAALLMALQVFVFAGYRNPMVDVLVTVNEKYKVDTAIRQGLDSLPGCLNRN